MTGPGPIGLPAGRSGVEDVLALRRQLLERADLLKAIQQQGQTAGAETAAPASDFGATLRSALDSVNASQRKAESLSEAYERGEVTDIAQVMLARQEAGVTFEATLQVRNRLLSAYQDIMRMGA